MRNKYDLKDESRPGSIGSGFHNQMNYISGANQRLSVFEFSSKHYFGQRCSVCKTDDLKYSVENSTGIYCRRCEQRAEFVNRERPHIVAAVRREAVKIWKKQRSALENFPRSNQIIDYSICRRWPTYESGLKSRRLTFLRSKQAASTAKKHWRPKRTIANRSKSAKSVFRSIQLSIGRWIVTQKQKQQPRNVLPFYRR